MIRPSSRPRRRIVGSAGFTLSLALALASSNITRAQDPALDGSSLARYVPKDNVVFYLEHDGLDKHADAWKKTAAYKILNNTPVGAMLEDVTVQLLNKLPAAISPGRTMEGGADLVALIKHVARSGFLFASFLDKTDNSTGMGSILVVRDGFKDKSIRAILAGILQRRNAPNTKAQAVVRAGHKVISGVDVLGKGFTWWVEESKKEDLVMVFYSPEAADVVLETLDGKRPNATDLPKRVELLRGENRFQPTGFCFFDPKPMKPLWETPQAQNFAKDYGYLGLNNITRVDFRWGFQDDALMSLARIATSGPRQGLLSVLDVSTLDKTKLPPIPPSVSGFTAASFDIAGSLDRLRAELKRWDQPDSDAMLDKFVERVKATTKLRLKEDILAHLGPNAAFYLLPGKAGAPPANPLAAFMPGGGADQIPKLAIVMEIDDPTAFGKVLDEAMIAVNRQLKSQGRPPGEPAKGGRGRGAGGGPPTVEFLVKSASPKMYALNVPSELSNQIPSTFRPAILVGPKHVVLAVSADVARLALDSKGKWTPPNELGLAWQGLGSKLKLLAVDDPRDSLPGLLAAFPAKVQVLANAALMARTPPPGAGAPPNPGPPANSDPNAGGSRRPMGAGPVGGNNPNANNNNNQPSAPGAPGAPPTGPSGGPSTPLVLQVDAAKLPSAEAIKALLFPSLFSIESDGDEIRISSRVAFPTIGDPSQVVVGMSLVLPAIQALRKGGPPPGMTPPPAGGTTPPSNNRGTNYGGSRPGASGNSSGGTNAPSKPD